MSLTKQISAIWSRITQRPAAPVQTDFSYGVVVNGPEATNGIINPIFVAQATPIAEKVIDILKQQGLKDEALEVTIGVLSNAAEHKGVRFVAPAPVVQAVADALPNHVVIRSDCRVISPTAKRVNTPRCEID